MALTRKKKKLLDACLAQGEISAVVDVSEINDDDAQTYILERARVNEAHKDLVVRALVKRLSEIIDFNLFDLFNTDEMGTFSFRPDMARKYGHLIQSVSFGGHGKIKISAVDKLGALAHMARLWGLYKEGEGLPSETGSMISVRPEFLP